MILNHYFHSTVRFATHITPTQCNKLFKILRLKNKLDATCSNNNYSEFYEPGNNFYIVWGFSLLVEKTDSYLFYFMGIFPSSYRKLFTISSTYSNEDFYLSFRVNRFVYLLLMGFFLSFTGNRFLDLLLPRDFSIAPHRKQILSSSTGFFLKICLHLFLNQCMEPP